MAVCAVLLQYAVQTDRHQQFKAERLILAVTPSSLKQMGGNISRALASTKELQHIRPTPVAVYQVGCKSLVGKYNHPCTGTEWLR
jgi:hypothetical protein